MNLMGQQHAPFFINFDVSPPHQGDMLTVSIQLYIHQQTAMTQLFANLTIPKHAIILYLKQ